MVPVRLFLACVLPYLYSWYSLHKINMSWLPYDKEIIMQQKTGRLTRVSQPERTDLRMELLRKQTLNNRALPVTRQKLDGEGKSSGPNNGTPYPSGVADGDMSLSLPSDENLNRKSVRNLRELTCSMHRKKEIRRRLINEKWYILRGGWKNELFLKWKRCKENVGEIFQHMTLWRVALREIEGLYGYGVCSYFVFLRWLFILNCIMFVVVFAFICVPAIFLSYNNNATVIPSATGTPANNSEECAYVPYHDDRITSFAQFITGWFEGKGYIEKTLLFYGYYENIPHLLPNSYRYNLPLAYVAVTFVYFGISLMFIMKQAATGVKESLISGEKFFDSYCNKVFSGWDFCITDERTANLKHGSFKYELETDLEEQRIKLIKESRTRLKKIVLYSKRAVISAIVLGVLAGCLFSIYTSAEFALTQGKLYEENFFLSLLVNFMVSLVITLANVVAPFLFEMLIKHEEYSPAFAVKLTLIRTVILRLVSVMFLYIVVYLQIHCEDHVIVDTQDSRNCGYCDGMPCWETYMGQEMYKLTIMDFLIVICVTLFIQFPRRMIVDYGQTLVQGRLTYQEFHVPSSVLRLVYTQTVGWIGAFYAPLLPAIVVVKFFVFFYLKKLTLMYNCKPSARPFRASKSGTFFFVVLMFGYLVAVIPVGFSLSFIKPSEHCGPFRGQSIIFGSVTDAFLVLPSWIQTIVWLFTSSGISFVLFVLLCLFLYYYASLNSARKEMITLFREKLKLDGKDKKYLIKRVNELQSWVLELLLEKRKKSVAGKALPLKKQTYSRRQSEFIARRKELLGARSNSLPGGVEDYED